ncbi:uncharacterized protein TNCV_3116741 [Trichonephila clavipes]|nr:uncharacterized protein TNCV_3116741 [Trichonephila clavipes]
MGSKGGLSHIEIARLYDPLGLIGPIVTKAKIFIQELWKIKLDWSEQLPLDAMEEWMNFYQKLSKINNFKIPRCILLPATIRIEIHGFSDASERAYAVVVYINLSPVWCSRPTTGVPLAHAMMNFVGLVLTTSDRWH